MPTREEQAAQWLTVSRSSRKAAQHLLEVECYRSSVSRAYYAAYAAITSALVAQGITFGLGGNNPGHAGLPAYILNNLTTVPLTRRFELNKAVRRLYAARVHTDYIAYVAGGRASALNGLRELTRIFVFLSLNVGEREL